MSSLPRPPSTPTAVAPPRPDPVRRAPETVPEILAGAGVPVARERQVLDALVAFARTLDPDHDVLELMGELTERAVALLAVSAAGVLLVDGTDTRGLTVAAASPGTRPLEVFAVELSSGPGGECVRGGVPVSSPIIEVDAARWPEFARAAVEAGYRAVHVLPMRLRGDVVGALTLLQDVPRALDDDDRRVGQTLADAATVGLLTHRGHRAGTVAQQLRHVLHRRVVRDDVVTGVLDPTAPPAGGDVSGSVSHHPPG